MATITQIVGTRTALNITGFNSLTSGSYATSDAYDCTTSDPLDVILEVNVGTPATTTGNQQIVVFGLASLDGTNYQTGPVAADEAVMNYVGSVPVVTDNANQTKMFSVASAFGGVLPPYFKIVVKNDCGNTLDSSNNTLYTATVIGNAA